MADGYRGKGKEQAEGNGLAPASLEEPDADDILISLEGESAGVWVDALATCPHVSPSTADIVADMDSLPRFDSFCAECGDPSENWMCATCKAVMCGRHVRGHMLQHHSATQHPLAFGFRDLSVWCFPCDSYLDAQANPDLRPIYNAFHIMKFGAPPPDRGGQARGGPLSLEMHLS